jgi:hypothetical protein
MKKISISILAISIISGLICFNFTKSQYNMSPDNSKKIIGSKSIMQTKIEPKSLDDLIIKSDLIVIGKVISEQTLYKEDLSKYIKNSKSIKEKEPGIDLTYSIAESQIQIDETLYGSVPDSKIITLAQLGNPNNDDGETKVKNGNKMLFILRKNTSDRITYSSIDNENGLFIINNLNMLTSLSDNIIVSKYDTISVNVLSNDIKKSIEKTKE